MDELGFVDPRDGGGVGLGRIVIVVDVDNGRLWMRWIVFYLGKVNGVFKFSFLVADKRLHKRLCPSVGPSVRWSIRRSVTLSLSVNKISV